MEEGNIPDSLGSGLACAFDCLPPLQVRSSNFSSWSSAYCCHYLPLVPAATEPCAELQRMSYKYFDFLFFSSYRKFDSRSILKYGNH